MITQRLSSRRSFLQAMALVGAEKMLFGAERLATLPTTSEEIRQAAKRVALRLKFRGQTPQDLAAWQQVFAAELRQRLGAHEPPKEWSTTALSRAELGDHTREEWLLASDGVTSLPLYVLRPAAVRHGAGPYPIVLALHGHGKFAHDAVVGIDITEERAANIKQSNYDYGRQLVREGYLVIAPCMSPFGRRQDSSSTKNDPCAITHVRLSLLGQTLMGANLRDLKWALNYAAGRSDARADRAGCIGLSYGGRMTMLMAALEPRIQVAVVSGALNLMQERIETTYSCGAQVIPGLLDIGDTPEIGSLIAPRPCIWELGSTDGLNKKEWVDEMKSRLANAYRAARKTENLQFHHFEGGHRWDGVTALPLLAQVLKRGTNDK